MIHLAGIVQEVAVTEHVYRALVIDQDPILFHLAAEIHNMKIEVLRASVIASDVVITVIGGGGCVAKVIGILSILILSGILIGVDVHAEHGVGGILWVLSCIGGIHLLCLIFYVWVFVGIMLLILPASVAEELQVVLLFIFLDVASATVILVGSHVPIIMLG